MVGRCIVLVLLGFTLFSSAQASTHLDPIRSNVHTFVLPDQAIGPQWPPNLLRKLGRLKPKGQGGQKAMAVTLGVLLGPFGVHRLYLGTEPVVPVFYTLTLGGGVGLLPAIDIIAILATKDLDQFKNSNKLIMWSD